ncbi:MAG: hypothetical protein U1E53_04980 [Dongiaceae bacterium]
MTGTKHLARHAAENGDRLGEAVVTGDGTGPSRQSDVVSIQGTAWRFHVQAG